MKYPKIISKFSEKYDFLDNSYYFPFEYEGVWYDNAEAAFQSTRLEHRKVFSHLSGSFARRYGARLPRDIIWEKDKKRIMFSVLMAKFSDPELKQRLLDTGRASLVYMNKCHENYWGICSCGGCWDETGQNELGELLMKVRRILSQK